MKINVELNIVGDGRVFLNYWDYMRGADVVCEIVDGKRLIRSSYVGEELEEVKTEMTFEDFIKAVEGVVSSY